MAGLLQQLVTEQAEQRPDSTALAMNGQRMSYAELEQASNQLARQLRAIGCQRGDRVCFLMPKSFAAIVSELGILKADCIYVPLDSSSPAPRLAKIVAACEPRCILAAGAVAQLLGDALIEATLPVAPLIGWMDDKPPQAASFRIEFSRCDLASLPSTTPDTHNSGVDTAHILFTSGSTGVPKGVMITHDNVLHFVEWAQRHFGTNHSDRISGHPPLHFDLSTFDIYATLGAGAELHLVPAELNLLPNKIADFIRHHELTQWFSVPSVLNYLAKLDVVAQNDFPSLKRLLWCGEVFPTPALRYWMQRLPHVTFTNLYGPTEATIASSFYTIPQCPADDDEAIPIGEACGGESLLVLGDDLQALPQDELGDLFIGGVGLSPGYWRDEQKTNEVFLNVLPHGRIYKTGDLAKVGEDGMVYFLGRADSQIKSRGYRIELGETETALNALGLLRECAVVAINTNGFEGATICCAYVPQSAASEQSDQTPATLRKALGRVLPHYMLPTRWMQFDRLPQNGNGKIDRRALRERFQEERPAPDTW